MGWLLLALVAGVVVFAAVHDLAARRRGTYRPPEEWEAARTRRRSTWAHRQALRRSLGGGGPEDPERQ